MPCYFVQLIPKGAAYIIKDLFLTAYVAAYVFSALALYTMARYRNIKKPWLAWVPVFRIWILGSLSDQYRYVVRGQVKSKRKILLIFNILSAIFGFVVFHMTMHSLFRGIWQVANGMAEDAVLEWILGSFLRMLGVALLSLPLVITEKVFEFMALYDVFRSCDPQNAVLFEVLSILLPVLKPVFLFCCRKREMGMPPRRMPAPWEEAAVSGNCVPPQESHDPDEENGQTEEFL